MRQSLLGPTEASQCRAADALLGSPKHCERFRDHREINIVQWVIAKVAAE